MRKLILTRRKSFVACLVTMKVYLEDHENSDLVINKIPCRFLGTLKNGQTAEFEIDQNERKLFVISDRLSKNYCNDFVTVPDGEFDVTLAGQNRYSYVSGNAFRFDGADEDTLANRKKNKSKGWVILAIALLVGFVIGFVQGILEDRPSSVSKTFTEAGISITLPENFEKFQNEDFDLCYVLGDYSILISKEYFSDMAQSFDAPDQMSAIEYGELICEVNDLDSECRESDGLVLMEYENEDGYAFFVSFHKSADAFFMVQFAVDAADLPEEREQLLLWAKTVSVTP